MWAMYRPQLNLFGQKLINVCLEIASTWMVGNAVAVAYRAHVLHSDTEYNQIETFIYYQTVMKYVHYYTFLN